MLRNYAKYETKYIFLEYISLQGDAIMGWQVTDRPVADSILLKEEQLARWPLDSYYHNVVQ